VPRELDLDTPFRFFGDEIHRHERGERVFRQTRKVLRRRQVNRAFQFAFQQRRLDLHARDLRGIRTQRVFFLFARRVIELRFEDHRLPTGMVEFFIAFEADLRVRARLQPVRRTRAQLHTGGQRDGRILDVRLRCADRIFACFLRHMQADVQPRRCAPRFAIRLDFERRAEIETFTTTQLRQRRAQRLEGTLFLPRIDAQRGGTRRSARGRVGQQGHFRRRCRTFTLGFGQPFRFVPFTL
jgi:hypothetical protein